MKPLFTLVIASTRTSTLPGLSIAGPTPEATLLTPGLDAEYLLTGRPLSLNVVPVSPEGVPTPGLIARAALIKAGITPIIIDAGSHLKPKIPHHTLPTGRMGGRIDQEPALPQGASRGLYEEARLLGRALAPRGWVVVGESMPGGTTTALSLLVALGYPAWNRVSSASPRNPRELKRRVVERALERLSQKNCGGDALCINDEVGDPLHVSIAGLARGVLEEGGRVTLAGGTQMAAALALLKHTTPQWEASPLPYRVEVATTRWIIEEEQSDLPGLLSEVDPRVGLSVSLLRFSSKVPRGLRLYEEGYGKEGVGAGGALVVAHRLGFTWGELEKAVAEEYERLTGGGVR